MKWSEHLIANAIARQTLQSKCVVLVPNCSWTGSECDVLAVTTDLRVIDVEVKISRGDLKADAGKDKWWRYPLGWHVNPETGRAERGHKMPLEWPTRVWKHYYALPKEIWTDSLLDCLPSPRSGVLLFSHQERGAPLAMTCQRRATPCRDAKKLTPEQVMDIARLANLRMWDALKELERSRCAAREAA